MRLAFMGTPVFAAVALQALIDAGHEIAAVYAQPARPAGRGQKPQPSPVENLARQHGLPVFTPISLKAPEEQAAFAALNLDAAVVAAYGLILPRAVLEAPKRGCFNIHGSLLPRWRGAAPIQRAILAGDAATGITIMQMEAGLDTGPMLLKGVLPITAETTGGSLHDALADLGARLMVQYLADPAAYPPEVQPEDGVTYAAKIDKAELKLDWSLPAGQLDRVIRTFAPKPGAWAEINGERVKVLAAVPAPGSGVPGTALDDAVTIATGEGALRLTHLQRPGKGPVAAADLLRGWPVPAGTLLH
ncbi:methionyl-tRNA formyltransferase [Elstera cyanobacteriorum]|uniref:Methionyl-tRNA formyltransferase n=1 Tax=Elstera cyanobacteriorum TaxID=2022747 RepID=A0A255XMC4_9PROT|nr:methionyl-tRNA formyltransferase [Elstera cyanobacteriorum]OYQ17420.1 methionyl-tRNA formyltransferase [Elstera cyanobacteriorum]GFZ93783.1 methionyl-tRNA formyltransferase [Elstera cyanobacteriorum]